MNEIITGDSLAGMRGKIRTFPAGRFAVIYADPPWTYTRTSPVTVKAGGLVAREVYPVMTLDELMALPVGTLAADDCLLFMWTGSPVLDKAICLGTHWGFAYVTVGFVWEKCRPTGGCYTLPSVELCLIFKRGRIPKPRGSRNERQFLLQERGAHSRKPDEVRARIERMFPHHRKIELFARGDFSGWEVWGNEAGADLSEPKFCWGRDVDNNS